MEYVNINCADIEIYNRETGQLLHTQVVPNELVHSILEVWQQQAPQYKVVTKNKSHISSIESDFIM
jgi:uncharacterized protein YpmS